MLVLSRKAGESIVVGSDVKIRVISVGKNRVRIGIEAPDQVRVLRGELVPPYGHDFPEVRGELLEEVDIFSSYSSPMPVLPR